MGKELKLDASPWNTRRRLIARAVVFALLVGFAFRLFLNQGTELSPEVSSGEVKASAATEDREIQKGVPLSTRCDLSVGTWVPRSSGPSYTNESCPIIEDHQNCLKNGRPDNSYLYWRWKPQDCDLKQFDARSFLDRMRNKSWAFIGDSISRNHVQSLVCLLSQVEQAVEIYHDADYKSKSWRFPSYNVTVAVIWSPFLLKAEIFEDINGVSTADIQLFLDILDKKWTVEYQKYDYILTSGGQWFLKTAIYWEKKKVVGCHLCPGQNITELGFEHAYRKALSLVLNYLVASYKGTILFRTSTPSHFENGSWFSGGTCLRTHPFNEGEATMPDAMRVMYDIELEEYNKVAAAGVTNGARLMLLDTSRLSLLRPDGHPGPYRHFQPFANNTTKVQNDCLHWCLPGPIDNWNDLVMELVIN